MTVGMDLVISVSKWFVHLKSLVKENKYKYNEIKSYLVILFKYLMISSKDVVSI